MSKLKAREPFATKAELDVVSKDVLDKERALREAISTLIGGDGVEVKGSLAVHARGLQVSTMMLQYALTNVFGWLQKERENLDRKAEGVEDAGAK